MRVKRAVISKARKKKILKSTKGYRGAASRRYSLAKERFYRSGAYAYVGRKDKKGEYRRLWIIRINAASRKHGLKYNQLIHGLKQAGVSINRKMLADVAVRDPAGFEKFAEIAKEALAR